MFQEHPGLFAQEIFMGKSKLCTCWLDLLMKMQLSALFCDFKISNSTYLLGIPKKQSMSVPMYGTVNLLVCLSALCLSASVCDILLEHMIWRSRLPPVVFILYKSYIKWQILDPSEKKTKSIHGNLIYIITF